MTTLDIVLGYRQALVDGLLVTLRLCAVVWTIGLVGGVLLGFGGARWPRSLGRIGRTLGFVLSGVPILVTLFWAHYPLQALLSVVVDPFITASLVLGLVNLTLVSDVVERAITDFPRQYALAGRVCGMSPGDIFLRIEAPLLLRQLVPGLLLIQVTMLQATLFASLISVDEVFRVTQRINAEIYRPVEVFSTLAVFFLGICLPLNGFALFLRRRFTRDISER